jgi:hypothetical protein
MPAGALFGSQVQYHRLLWRGTAATTLLAAFVGGWYFFAQPVVYGARLNFQPVFEGARAGRYPNGLLFSPTDIVHRSVIDQVFATNALQGYCDSATFASGFIVEEGSPAMARFDEEYRARLSDTRLTPVDRRRLQEDYANRRAGLERRYRLTFVHPANCAAIPSRVLLEALPEILETWALDAREKRGVNRVRVPVLTTTIFDDIGAADETLLVKADLLRTAISRVVTNILRVEEQPGAQLVRGSEKNISLREVRAGLEDLMKARLDPLIVRAASSVPGEAAGWVNQALRSSTIRLRAAQQRSDVYRTALREYSRVAPSAPADVSPEPGQSPSDVQALTPQIDSTFIDRIVELSSLSTAFRQELTRSAIEASVEAADRAAVVEHYRELLSAIRANRGAAAAPRDVDMALRQVAAEAKEATRRFNEIYAEFSRRSLGAGLEMYRIERRPEMFAMRRFATRSYFLLLLGVMIAAPVVIEAAVRLRLRARRRVAAA